MSLPLVSILIPAYNAERTIAETVECALSQSWPNKEIIVVDDGSKDATAACAEKFSARGVKLVRQSNAGAAAARNHAFRLSSGEFIQWLDADDLISADKIASQIKIALAEPSRRVLYSCAWAHFMYRSSKAKEVRTGLWCDLAPLEWLLRKLETGAFMPIHSWLLSRQLAEAAGEWNTGLPVDDDGEYFFRIISRSERIQFVPNAKAYYRRTTSGRLSYLGSSQRKLEGQLRVMKMKIEYLKAFGETERTRQACLSYLRQNFFYFYPEREDLVKELDALATSFNAILRRPRLPWKYIWIEKLFGCSVAKRSELRYNEMKQQVLIAIDKLFYRWETTLGDAKAMVAFR